MKINNRLIVPVYLRNRRGSYEDTVLATGPIAYWPLYETSGTDAVELVGGLDGAYTGATLGQDVAPFVCPYFDGTNDFVNIYSAGLDAVFNGQEFTVAIWIKPDGAFWTDTLDHYAIKLYSSSSNRVYIAKDSQPAGRLWFYYAAGGTIDNVIVAGLSFTEWSLLAVTVSKTADELKAYLNGAQQGSTQTGLGTYAGAMNSAHNVIGADNALGANVHLGWLAHAAVWDKILTEEEILALYEAGGV